MPVSCSAFGCTNRTSKPDCIARKVSFHNFPHFDDYLMKVWLVKMRRENFVPSSHTKLCSDHFEPHCFVNRKGCRRLSKDAVPTIFSFCKTAHTEEYLSREPAKLEDVDHPDWIPSREMGYGQDVSNASLSRYLKERCSDDLNCSASEPENVAASGLTDDVESMDDVFEYMDNDMNINPNLNLSKCIQTEIPCVSVSTQTDITGTDIMNMLQSYRHLVKELRVAQSKLQELPLKENDNDKTKNFTGREDKLPSIYSKVCSCHFEDSLRENGPTIFERNQTTAPKTLGLRTLAPKTLAPKTLTPKTLTPKTLTTKTVTPTTLTSTTLTPTILTLTPAPETPKPKKLERYLKNNI